MLYIWLDVHKEFCQSCVIDESGRALSNERFSSAKEELNRFLDKFQDAKFVMESTGIWEFICESIERRGFEVQLAHPLKVSTIAESRVKTDKVDTHILARLLAANLIPRSWISKTM
jgi:transposase